MGGQGAAPRGDYGEWNVVRAQQWERMADDGLSLWPVPMKERAQGAGGAQNIKHKFPHGLHSSTYGRATDLYLIRDRFLFVHGQYSDRTINNKNETFEVGKIGLYCRKKNTVQDTTGDSNKTIQYTDSASTVHPQYTNNTSAKRTHHNSKTTRKRSAEHRAP
eukprot:scaffold5892_cov112-Isochrysis_galbana.AAC.8